MHLIKGLEQLDTRVGEDYFSITVRSHREWASISLDVEEVKKLRAELSKLINKVKKQ